MARWRAIPQADLPDFYASADVCAVPSFHESFGLAALEAMACGTPVVAADVGALSSIVLDGETGRLVGSHEPRAFAAALEELLHDPEGLSRMGEAAREWASGFTWDRSVEETLDGYRSVLTAGSERRLVAPCV